MSKHETSESGKHIENGKKKKLVKCLKNTGAVLLLILSKPVVDGAKSIPYIIQDIQASKRMKDDDKFYFGVMDAKRDSTGTPEGIIYTQYDDINGDGKIDENEQTILNISFQDVINHNKGLLGKGLGESSLQAIIMGEDELKTKNSIGKQIQNGDDKLLSGRWGEERSKNGEGFLGRALAILGPGSYGPFQVQRESIDDYKGEVEVYNKICNDIANFMLPNKDNEREKLYKQLGYPTPENMIEDIKNHKINMYEGGGRFQIAYGIVLINQVDKRITSMVDSYDGDKGYDRWDSNTRIVESEHTELLGNNNEIMSPYILKNKGLITYEGIGQIFNDNTFKEGVRPAYRCMDHIEKVENSNYLFWLSLLELDEWFNSNDKGKLDILIPTGRFGPGTVGLVNKHFNQNFNKDDEGMLAARKFMDELSTEELEKIKEKGLNKFEQNMRLLYTLNPEDRNRINKVMSEYLSECLDLSFNHVYAAVTVFPNFIKFDNVKFNYINNKRQDYVKNQNKESLEEIKKIMTDEETFISFTGLDGDSFKKWIKYGLGPIELGVTDWVWQTGLIVPVIQDQLGGGWFKNEQNSIARFDIGVRLGQEAKIEQEKGIRYKVKGENGIFHMDNNLESTLALTSNPREYVRRALFDDETVHNYLESQCITYEGNKIESPLSIPDELIEEIVRDKNGDYFSIETITPGDTIRFKIDGKTIYKYFDNLGDAVVRNNLGDAVIKGKTICKDNGDGTYNVKEGGNLQTILSEYYKGDNRVKEAIIKLNGGKEVAYGKIPRNIIEKMITDENGKKLRNVDKVPVDQKIRIQGFSNKILCVDNGNGTYTVQNGANLQDIVSYYYKNDNRVRREINRLNGGNPVEIGKIPTQVIKKLVSDRNGNGIDVNNIKKLQVIRFGIQLNNL